MCTLQWNSFKERFPKSHRPEITDLEDFWSNEAAALFRDFAEYILCHYDLRFGVPIWSATNGWTYRIGKSGVYLITGIRIVEKGFWVDNIMVKDRAGFEQLLEHVSKIYQKNGYAFQKEIFKKNAKQAERNKARIDRERKELAALREMIVPGKYNVFHWPAKLDIYKLKRLYMQDARGIQDMELVDEIGLTLYLRCKYGKEDRERMERFALRCHHCEREVTGDGDFRQCSCGYQYSYREYRRSYRKNNMPSGAAAKVFEAFMEKWCLAAGYSEMMILIDTLLHEFHVSLVSGAVHRPVAMNFMEGTRKQVEQMVNELARE